MIFDRIAGLRGFFGFNDRAAVEVARRWRRAFAAEPDLAADLIRQSGLLVQQPVQMTEGVPEVVPLDPYRLAYEAGRRDMALLLLAQGGLSHTEINQLMENDHEF